MVRTVLPLDWASKVMVTWKEIGSSSWPEPWVISMRRGGSIVR